MNRKIFLSFLFAAYAFLCSDAKEKRSTKLDGTISGVVLTEEGRPAADFQVCTQVHRKQSWMDETETCCSARTNNDGQFTIEHLDLGTYEVLASNDAEGYSIANQSPGQSVAVSEKQLRQNATIRLHDKGAVIWASITDKSTGKTIHDAQLSYSGIDCEAGGNMLKDLDGQYYLPIPVNCDVVVIARARGYRGFIYVDEANSKPVLRLTGSERKELDIKLEPLPKVLPKK